MIYQENNNNTNNKIDFFIGDYLDQLSEATFDAIISEPIDVSVNTQNKIYSLRKSLLNLYISESEKKTDAEQHLNSATKLIDKLVKRDNLNTLILNLHANNEGYSFIINSNPIIQTERLPYEENEFFDYVNNGEIPPIIIDLFDKIKTNLFYDGCIILEIRDYRYCLNNEIKNKLFNTNYSVNYVLLRPSIQSLLADLNNITNDGQYIWTQDDKYELESKLLLLTSEPLCLNPNPIVSVVQSKLNQHKYKLRDRKLKRFAKRQSQPYINRGLNYDDYELDYPFHILKIRKNHPLDRKYSPSHKPIFPIIEKRNNYWSDQRLNINLPRNDLILVKKFAKPFEKPKFTNDMTLVPVEEIILEADRNMKNNYSKLVIKRRASDGLYFCSLVLRNEESSEVLFQLGTYNDAEKYVRQYIDIFKEYGRRFVIPKHSVFDNKTYKPILEDATSRLDNNNSSTAVPFYTLFNSNEIIDKQVQLYYQSLTLKLAAKRKSQSETDAQSATTSTVSSPSTPSTPTSSQAITRVYANIQPAKVPLISKLNDVSQQPKVFKIDSNNSPKATKIETIPSNKIVTTTPTSSTSSQIQLQNLNKVSLNANNIIQIHLPKLITTSSSSSSTANNSITQNENKIITTTTTASINGTNSASQQQIQQPKIQLVTINNPTNTVSNTLSTLNEKKMPKKRIIKKTINTTTPTPTTSTNKSGPQLTQATLINASNLNLITKSVQPQKLTIKTIPAASSSTSSTPTINLVGVNKKAQSPLRVNPNQSTIFTANRNAPQAAATTSNSSQLLNNLLTNNCAAVQLNIGSNAVSNTSGPIVITSSNQNQKVSTTPIQSQQSQLPKLAAAPTTQSQNQGIVLPPQLLNAIISPGTSSSSTAITTPIVTPRRPGRPKTVLSADSIKTKQQPQQTTPLNKRQKKNSIS